MSPKSGEQDKTLALPPPARQGERSLEEALASRRSVREYSDRSPSQAQLGQLLWATQGITSPEGDRTAPSAGGLFPLETYLVTAAGVYRYQPRGHLLRRLVQEDRRPRLWRAALEQECVLEAPVTFVLAAVCERTARKYGRRRGRRYVYLEAGHAAQNLLLEAVTLDLGAVVIGAFEDRDVQTALSLPADHEPIYLIPVGFCRD